MALRRQEHRKRNNVAGRRNNGGKERALLPQTEAAFLPPSRELAAPSSRLSCSKLPSVEGSDLIQGTPPGRDASSHNNWGLHSQPPCLKAGKLWRAIQFQSCEWDQLGWLVCVMFNSSFCLTARPSFPRWFWSQESPPVNFQRAHRLLGVPDQRRWTGHDPLRCLQEVDVGTPGWLRPC